MRSGQRVLATALVGLLATVIGCGCSDDSIATPSPAKPDPPDVSQQPAPTTPEAPQPEPVAKPKPRPPIKPDPPPKQPTPSQTEAAVAKLIELGGRVQKNSQGDVIGVWLVNGNKNARKAIQHVANLPTIEKLYLTDTSINDADMHFIFPLKNLRWLKLRGTKITSAGMAYLADKKKLEYLNVINTKVGDSGMKHLYGLTSLKTLYLGGTNVKKPAGDALRKKLPKLTIK
jgi:hypothetical protein